MFLLTCKRAETISRVHGEINEITGHSFGSLAHVGWFWLSAPFNARAIRVDQLLVKPLHNDVLVTDGVNAVTRGIWCRRLGIQAANKNHSQRERANQRLRHERFHVFCLPPVTAVSPA